MREYYTITELTREFGISTRTLRFYEDEGLIAPVRRGRTRLFRPADRHLVKHRASRRIGRKYLSCSTERRVPESTFVRCPEPCCCSLGRSCR